MSTTVGFFRTLHALRLCVATALIALAGGLSQAVLAAPHEGHGPGGPGMGMGMGMFELATPSVCSTPLTPLQTSVRRSSRSCKRPRPT